MERPRYLFVVRTARGFIRAIKEYYSGVNLAGAAHNVLQDYVNFDLARGMQDYTECCEIWHVAEDNAVMEKILTVF